MNRCPLSTTVTLLWWPHRCGLPSVQRSGQRLNLPLRSLASTDVKIILADVLRTTRNLAVLVLQSLAANAAEVESNVFFFFFTAPRLPIRVMESLAVRVHIGHCCVSVGLLAVLHLCCTRDELDLGLSMLPWHSMAAV